MNEDLLQQLLNEIKDIKSNMATKSDINTIKNELIVIKQSIQLIEQSQPNDIYAILKNISNKLEERDSEVLVLNKRIFKVESVIERLTNQ